MKFYLFHVSGSMRMSEEGRWHLVRVGGRELPSYTPDIEHLVFPRGQPHATPQTTCSKVKAARSRLAGVLALTRSVARHNRNNAKVPNNIPKF